MSAGAARLDNPAPIDRDTVVNADKATLARLLAGGHAVDPSALAGWRYRGTSLGLPAWVDRIAWKTFEKVFHRDPQTGRVRGWNVRIRQDLDPQQLEPMLRHGRPLSFGHFEVTDLEAYQPPRPVGGGVMLDYGRASALSPHPPLPRGERGRSKRFDPTSRLRDPLVALVPGNADLLLGWSYVDLGFTHISTPSYFLLERHSRLTAIVARPSST